MDEKLLLNFNSPELSLLIKRYENEYGFELEQLINECLRVQVSHCEEGIKNRETSVFGN